MPNVTYGPPDDSDRSSVQPDLLYVGTPVPTENTDGFGILLKRPGQGWKRTLLHRDGKPLATQEFNADFNLLACSLVHGWHSATNQALYGWPYQLVVNPRGHNLQLPYTLTLRDMFDRNYALPLHGPVFLLKRRPVKGRANAHWDAATMDFDGADRNCLHRAHLEDTFDYADSRVDEGLFAVNLTTQTEA